MDIVIIIWILLILAIFGTLIYYLVKLSGKKPKEDKK